MSADAAGAPAPAGGSPPDEFDPARATRLVARACAAARPGRFTAVSVRVPRFDPVPALGMRPAADAFYWRDRDGRVLAGAGRALLLTASGDDRVASIRGQATALADELDRVAADNGPQPPLPFFGGFAFRAGSAAAEPWSGFGDARFLLPELGYYAEETSAWLTLTLAPESTAESSRVDAALERVRGVLDAAGAGTTAVHPDQTDEELALRDPMSGAPRPYATEAERQAFTALVRAALLRLEGGGIEKLVVARRTRVGAPSTIDLPRLLGQLRRAVGTFRFAVAADGRVFLGATPERLVARDRDTARTEALAGTAPAGGDADGAPIDASDKNRREHDIVVQSIAQSMGPLCTVLSYDPAPLERRAGPVRHLSTRFECTMRESAHVLELVERLHPTPAIGGWPTAAAVEWLARHEDMARGWYAAPVGWFDLDGNGEFAVALRCGVLRPGALDLFAGAGIVAGSDPDTEFEETRWKLRALPNALGLEP